VLYLSALLALKKGEVQGKVVNLLSKTVEMHLGGIRVLFVADYSLTFCV